MPAWVASESKWEKAKKLARKQYPGVTGDAFWARVAGIYKQMGGKVEKSRKLGDKHAKHSYLSRTGQPGKYSYAYQPAEDDDDDQEGLPGPGDGDDDEDDRPAKTAPPQQNGDNPPKKVGVKATRSQFTQNQKKPGVQLQQPSSVLRDARPEDLEEDNLVLWMATDERTFQAMKQQGKFIGADPDQGNTLSATREGALGVLEESQDRPGAPMLLAVRTPVDALEPMPDAESVEESLFPDNPAMSQAHVVGNIPGNAIVGIVQEGDPLWPQDKAEEQAKVDDMQPDTDNEVPQ
jgi:hypothetical protein